MAAKMLGKAAQGAVLVGVGVFGGSAGVTLWTMVSNPNLSMGMGGITAKPVVYANEESRSMVAILPTPIIAPQGYYYTLVSAVQHLRASTSIIGWLPIDEDEVNKMLEDQEFWKTHIPEHEGSDMMTKMEVLAQIMSMNSLPKTFHSSLVTSGFVNHTILNFMLPLCSRVGAAIPKRDQDETTRLKTHVTEIDRVTKKGYETYKEVAARKQGWVDWFLRRPKPVVCPPGATAVVWPSQETAALGAEFEAQGYRMKPTGSLYEDIWGPVPEGHKVPEDDFKAAMAPQKVLGWGEFLLMNTSLLGDSLFRTS